MVESKEECIAPQPGTPQRLANLIQRLAQLKPGRSYDMIVMILPDGQVVYDVLERGKVENYRSNIRD